MAPMKRVRPRQDDGDESVYDIEQASSNLRRDSRKKARISIAEDRDDGSEPDHGAAVRENGTRRRGDNEEVDEYERHRDAGFEDLQWEDIDDQRASQLIMQRNGVAMDNVPAENGIIEAVECINFMCHSHLKLTFGPLINFIIGHNGSGKSAVLTALTLCLGGKATSTNRGQSLKSFIKEGQEHASLIVKLKNQGAGAYMPDVYGGSIIVERHFSRSGSSGFKIKSAEKRLITTKKADLEDIVDFFALQLDNPMNVLTQDMARQFLSHSNGTDKYRFFIKGVQLEQLDHDYRLLADSTEKMEAKMGPMGNDIDALKKRMNEAQSRVNASERLNTLRDDARRLRRELAWTQVAEQEKILAHRENEIRRIEDKIEQVKQRADDAERELEEASTSEEQAQQAITGLRDELRPLEEERQQADDKFRSNSTELTAVHTQQRHIKETLRESNATIKKHEDAIAVERQRLEAANGGEHSRKLNEIEEAKEHVARLKEQYAEQISGDTRLAEGKAAANDKLQRHKETVERKRDEVRTAENRWQDLSRSRGQQLSAFHPNVSTLLRAIQSETRFREKPVGPIGNHVRLLKPEWSSVLERSFGTQLNSFVVTSKQDQSLLSELMRRTQCVNPILIGSKRPINTSNHEPHSSFDTWMRVLDIDNDLVRNQLIINQGIEQTLLIQDRERAFEVVYEKKNSPLVYDEKCRPRNVRQCFCLMDRSSGKGVRLGFSRSGGRDMSSIPRFEGRPRMKTDIEAQIALQRETVTSLKRQVDDLERTQRELETEFTRCSQAIVRHQRGLKDLRIEVQRAEERQEYLQDQLEQETPQDGRLDALEGLLKEAKDEHSIYVSSYQDSVNAKDNLSRVGKERKEILDAKKRAVQAMEESIHRAEIRANKLTEQRHQKLLEKNAAFQAIDDANSDKADMERLRDRQAALVEQFIGQASQISERVPVPPGETIKNLEKRIDRNDEQMRRQEQQNGGNHAELTRALAEAKMAHDRARKDYKNMENLAQHLKSTLINRQDRWRKFRRFISSRARGQFMYLLANRDFRGNLKIDHKLRVIEIHVQPDIHEKHNQGRATRTLSGGEKSFSTICLLLAIWEAMGSSIRCLDEFDVFMDNVNREISMKMMISAARQSSSRQFILITPQAMSNVHLAGDVKIIRMSDPERGQPMLNFGT